MRKYKTDQVQESPAHEVSAWKNLAVSRSDRQSSLTPVEVEPGKIHFLMAQGWSYCHDVDNGLRLQWYHVGETLEASHLHGLSTCVLRFRVLVTHRHPGGYFGT